MMDNNNGISCQLGCWALAAGVGALAFVLLLVLGDYNFIGAVFLGGVIFAILGALLSWLFCTDLPKLGEVKPGERKPSTKPATGATPATHGGAAAAATSGSSTSGPAASASTASGTTARSGGSSDDSGATASGGGAAALGSEADAGAGSDTDTGTETGASAASGAATASDAGLKPSAPLAGEAELAERKGSWKYEGDGEASASGGAKGDSVKSASTSDSDSAVGKAAAGSAAGDKATGAGGASTAGDDASAAAEGPGSQPEALSAARDGGPDNLKEIKGVGPALENLCHALGIFHFDQIAGWGPQEVAWMDENLKGFKGRVTRDNWVEQAKVLAAGGETEFSKRVDKGGVY